jgi:hypothetical protein
MAESNGLKVGDPVQMLRGYPATAIARLSARMAIFIAASIAMTVVLVVIFGDEFSGRPIFGFVVAVIVLLVVATGVVHTTGKVKEARELYSGYTTIMRAHRDMDQVDPDSGRVVRAAGEPFLTQDQYDSRIALVRKSIQKGDPMGGGRSN